VATTFALQSLAAEAEVDVICIQEPGLDKYGEPNLIHPFKFLLYSRNINVRPMYGFEIEFQHQLPFRLAILSWELLSP
jgi:hypothetical protein